MSFHILEECIECGVCIPECPEGCIAEGTPYTIDPKLCTECSACAEVCPVDVCLPMPEAQPEPQSEAQPGAQKNTPTEEMTKKPQASGG